MATGKKAATGASRILSEKSSTKQEKKVAASDLAQAKKPSATKPGSKK